MKRDEPRFEFEPTIELVVTRSGPGYAVGYFAEDVADPACFHGPDDRDGAERCLEALLREHRRVDT